MEIEEEEEEGFTPSPSPSPPRTPPRTPALSPPPQTRPPQEPPPRHPTAITERTRTVTVVANISFREVLQSFAEFFENPINNGVMYTRVSIPNFSATQQVIVDKWSDNEIVFRMHMGGEAERDGFAFANSRRILWQTLGQWQFNDAIATFNFKTHMWHPRVPAEGYNAGYAPVLLFAVQGRTRHSRFYMGEHMPVQYPILATAFHNAAPNPAQLVFELPLPEAARDGAIVLLPFPGVSLESAQNYVTISARDVSAGSFATTLELVPGVVPPSVEKRNIRVAVHLSGRVVRVTVLDAGFKYVPSFFEPQFLTVQKLLGAWNEIANVFNGSRIAFQSSNVFHPRDTYMYHQVRDTRPGLQRNYWFLNNMPINLRRPFPRLMPPRSQVDVTIDNFVENPAEYERRKQLGQVPPELVARYEQRVVTSVDHRLQAMMGQLAVIP